MNKLNENDQRDGYWEEDSGSGLIFKGIYKNGRRRKLWKEFEATTNIIRKKVLFNIFGSVYLKMIYSDDFYKYIIFDKPIHYEEKYE